LALVQIASPVGKSMHIDLNPRGCKVVIFGDAVGARQALRRFLHSGATVTVVLDGPLPDPEQRLSTVRYTSRPARTDTAALLRLIGPAWLIVDVGLPRAFRERVWELAGHLHVLMITEDPAPSGGQVTLVGGGPGRTSLLTLEACAALRQADVVFFDRLAPTEDLDDLAAGAELVDVGKSPNHHPVPQHAISEQMITRARRGQSVVRLKGGDPFVFGRGGEELLTCVAAGIGVRIVPGISSAISVPAACGIPVTHREISKAFTVISGHTPPEAHELEALVRLGGTIVILMGIGNLAQTMAGLARAGLPSSTPAAVIERGFSDAQRSIATTAGALVAEVRRLDITSPAVVVIGDVVAVAPSSALSAEVLEAPAPRWSAPEARAS
jgi:uroporphyrin-III C-methyltransferase